MKIYRCILGFLMVFFIIVGVWYVVSCYDEQRSMEDGTLILKPYLRNNYQNELDWNEENFGGLGENGTDNDLYQG